MYDASNSHFVLYLIGLPSFKDTILLPAMDLCSINKQRNMSTKFHASNIGFGYKWAFLIGRE